jgi:hypothetical protein
MRNDARPIGASVDEKSPIGGEHAHDANRPADDPRPSVTHDRQSHVINRGAEENAKRDDADIDPVMPTGDSTLKTKI